MVALVEGSRFSYTARCKTSTRHSRFPKGTSRCSTAPTVSVQQLSCLYISLRFHGAESVVSVR